MATVSLNSIRHWGLCRHLVRSFSLLLGIIVVGITTLFYNVNAYAQCDRGETLIKFSHVVAERGNPKGEAAVILANRVNREMNGRICMEVFPNSTLYDDNKVLEAMLLGDVQLAAPSLSKLEKYTKSFRIYDLPFLFEDANHVYRFQDSMMGKKLSRGIEKVGFQLLEYWPNGMKQISAGSPLFRPTDAAGLKFRIMSSDVLQKQFEALDASPQKLAFSEVYGALQNGVVDGQENTYSNIYTKKFYEVQDGITESNHGILTYGLIIGQEFLTSLKNQDRSQLLRIIREVTQQARTLAATTNADAKAKIIAAGGVIHTLTPELRAEWETVMKPVWDEFSDDIGQEFIDAAIALK